MQIRIDEEVYERLKRSAEADKRTVSQQIDYLLSNRVQLVEIAAALRKTVDITFGAVPAPLATPAEKKESKPAGLSGEQYSSYEKKSRGLRPVRTAAVVEAEIRKLEAERDELIDQTQDGEHMQELYYTYGNRIDVLREELKEL